MASPSRSNSPSSPYSPTPTVIPDSHDSISDMPDLNIQKRRKQPQQIRKTYGSRNRPPPPVPVKEGDNLDENYDDGNENNVKKLALATSFFIPETEVGSSPYIGERRDRWKEKERASSSNKYNIGGGRAGEGGSEGEGENEDEDEDGMELDLDSDSDANKDEDDDDGLSTRPKKRHIATTMPDDSSPLTPLPPLEGEIPSDQVTPLARPRSKPRRRRFPQQPTPNHPPHAPARDITTTATTATDGMPTPSGGFTSPIIHLSSLNKGKGGIGSQTTVMSGGSGSGGEDSRSVSSSPIVVQAPNPGQGVRGDDGIGVRGTGEVQTRSVKTPLADYNRDNKDSDSDSEQEDLDPLTLAKVSDLKKSMLGAKDWRDQMRALDEMKDKDVKEINKKKRLGKDVQVDLSKMKRGVGGKGKGRVSEQGTKTNTNRKGKGKGTTTSAATSKQPRRSNDDSQSQREEENYDTPTSSDETPNLKLKPSHAAIHNENDLSSPLTSLPLSQSQSQQDDHDIPPVSSGLSSLPPSSPPPRLGVEDDGDDSEGDKDKENVGGRQQKKRRRGSSNRFQIPSTQSDVEETPEGKGKGKDIDVGNDDDDDDLPPVEKLALKKKTHTQVTTPTPQTVPAPPKSKKDALLELARKRKAQLGVQGVGSTDIIGDEGIEEEIDNDLGTTTLSSETDDDDDYGGEKGKTKGKGKKKGKSEKAKKTKEKERKEKVKRLTKKEQEEMHRKSEALLRDQDISWKIQKNVGKQLDIHEVLNKLSSKPKPKNNKFSKRDSSTEPTGNTHSPAPTPAPFPPKFTLPNSSTNRHSSLNRDHDILGHHSRSGSHSFAHSMMFDRSHSHQKGKRSGSGSKTGSPIPEGNEKYKEKGKGKGREDEDMDDISDGAEKDKMIIDLDRSTESGGEYGMSEKAKGKRRASSPIEDSDDELKTKKGKGKGKAKSKEIDLGSSSVVKDNKGKSKASIIKGKGKVSPSTEESDFVQPGENFPLEDFHISDKDDSDNDFEDATVMLAKGLERERQRDLEKERMRKKREMIASGDYSKKVDDDDDDLEILGGPGSGSPERKRSISSSIPLSSKINKKSQTPNLMLSGGGRFDTQELSYRRLVGKNGKLARKDESQFLLLDDGHNTTDVKSHSGRTGNDRIKKPKATNSMEIGEAFQKQAIQNFLTREERKQLYMSRGLTKKEKLKEISKKLENEAGVTNTSVKGLQAVLATKMQAAKDNKDAGEDEDEDEEGDGEYNPDVPEDDEEEEDFNLLGSGSEEEEGSGSSDKDEDEEKQEESKVFSDEENTKLQADQRDVTPEPQHPPRKSEEDNKELEDKVPNQVANDSVSPARPAEPLEAAANPVFNVASQAGFGDLGGGGGLSQFFADDFSQAAGQRVGMGLDIPTDDDPTKTPAQRPPMPSFLPSVQISARGKERDAQLMDAQGAEMFQARRASQEGPSKQYLNEQGLFTQTKPLNFNLEDSPMFSQDPYFVNAAHLFARRRSSISDSPSVKSLPATASFQAIDGNISPTRTRSGPPRLLKRKTRDEDEDTTEVGKSLSSEDTEDLTPTQVVTISNNSYANQTAEAAPAQKNAFDALRAGAQAQAVGTDSNGPEAKRQKLGKNSFVDAEVEEEEDNTWGADLFRRRRDGEDDEDGEDDGRDLEGFVDQEDEEETEEQRALRLEKQREHEAADEAAVHRRALDVVHGKTREKRKNRGLDFDDSDFSDDSDDEYGVSKKPKRNAKQREGLDKLERLANNKKTSAFVDSLRQSALPNTVLEEGPEKYNFLESVDEPESEDEGGGEGEGEEGNEPKRRRTNRKRKQEKDPNDLSSEIYGSGEDSEGATKFLNDQEDSDLEMQDANHNGQAPLTLHPKKMPKFGRSSSPGVDNFEWKHYESDKVPKNQTRINNGQQTLGFHREESVNVRHAKIAANMAADGDYQSNNNKARAKTAGKFSSITSFGRQQSAGTGTSSNGGSAGSLTMQKGSGSGGGKGRKEVAKKALEKSQSGRLVKTLSKKNSFNVGGGGSG